MPICDDDVKPYVGQVFKCEADAFKFYRTYGYESGFDVRKGGAKKGKYDQVIYRYFYYQREGINPTKRVETSKTQRKIVKRRRKPSTRNDCKARMTVRIQNETEYVVTKGSGKRLKSTFEKEVQKAKKPKRRCKKCGRLVRHDSRNCGKVQDEDDTDEE
ncbi:putative protein FAR1-RELATED SEQUENCE 10 [Salvia miltiorrhiza]|uniref:putative protein FAR1-RELATED SEQUENCE 10 n=1 Tax=Salvia miltiorrhiza TaxID=226208 RepID=UPI0025ABAC49|nr:putative protein FAR1-RELATED SEQUENCE 10 [Salvia miltiorrhiza]